MYGDTELMRKRAAELREQGVDLRAMADRLVARTEDVGWTGRAADALAERIRDRAAHLRDIAARHDAAAESLEAHLLEVDRLKDAIARAERRADHLAEDGRAFPVPPPGHKDWLAVDLPGL
jgi:chromosome segregation ATPase